MMPSDKPNLAVLQQRRLRKSRTDGVIAQWATLDVTCSVLSDGRHEELLSRFREPGGSRRKISAAIEATLEAFGNACDLVAAIGWNVDEEPALLLRGDALAQSQAFLRTTYPDGFVAANQPFTRALIIDFDESDYEIDEVCLAAG